MKNLNRYFQKSLLNRIVHGGKTLIIIAIIIIVLYIFLNLLFSACLFVFLCLISFWLFHACMCWKHHFDVRLDGWCDCGFVQHREDWRLCERQVRVESPGAYVGDWVSRGHFCLVPVAFRTSLPCSGSLSQLLILRLWCLASGLRVCVG